MSQPVKLSNSLVLDARLAGDLGQRSIASQVEYWARLGRSVELLLNGQQVLHLSQTSQIKPLSTLLQEVDQPAGNKRLQTFLASQPFPHYRPAPGKPGLLERTDQDGTCTIGRFINREFIAEKTTRPRTRKPTRTSASKPRATSVRATA